MKYNYFFILLISFLIAVSANAAEVKIDSAIIKLPRAGQNVTAGFMQIKSSEKLLIKKISSEYIDNIEIHSMKTQYGVMKMRKMLRPMVSPKNPLILKHGGDHLMLFGINKDFKIGDEISLTFEFENSNNEILSKNFTFITN
tara:strand:- start:287 stop:712 length:426 start_codon:yes stop_codon:yes gene_type:complete